MFAQTFFHTLLLLTLGPFANAQESYVAAVVEYGFSRDPSISDFDNVLEVARTYEGHIERARTNFGAQIIVFPEYGLTTQNLPNNLESISTAVPSPSEGVIPCMRSESNFTKHLINLSCAALRHQIHVVVNLIERANSSANTTIYFNTNVVLDERGAVVARYRKINLINEDMFTPGEEVVTFRASFGVTFGLLTSTDLLMKNPAMTLMHELQVTDLIYPNFWHSETPFLKGLSIQDGFSKAYGVNILSSGYSNPREGAGGAGIFLANATIGAMSLSATVVQSLNAARVNVITTRTPASACETDGNISPRIGGQLPGIDLFEARLENTELYTFADLELGVNETSETVCSEGSQFCCEFNIAFNAPLINSSTIYKMAAFYGVRSLANSTSTIGVRNCALVACLTEESSSCGARLSFLNVDFARISIRAEVPSNEDTSYQPSTLNSDLEPIRSYAFCQGDVEDGKVAITLTTERTSGLLTFGIFGRAYDLDGGDVGRGFASRSRAMATLVLSSALAVFFI